MASHPRLEFTKKTKCISLGKKKTRCQNQYHKLAIPYPTGKLFQLNTRISAWAINLQRLRTERFPAPHSKQRDHGAICKCSAIGQFCFPNHCQTCSHAQQYSSPSLLMKKSTISDGKDRHLVLWLIFIGLPMLFCASLLASEPLIANDSAAGESAPLEIPGVSWQVFFYLHSSRAPVSITTGQHLSQDSPDGF